jgi:hypothetical protein
MRFEVFLTVVVLFAAQTCFGQNTKRYHELKIEAEKFYDIQDYEKSAIKYEDAFNQLDGAAIPYDRYNAACSYALAKDKEKSFYHLFRLANAPQVKYKNYDHITKDTDLKFLHTDKRWSALLEIVKSNKEEAEKLLDKPLIATLDSIHNEDQKYRQQLGEIREKHGWKSDEMSAQWKIINHKDSINLIKIKKILNERGWLGPKIIGEKGSQTLFLVIQHSKIDVQLKYLPMMREAVTKGNSKASSLALLEDRVALRQGKRQIYGSQIDSGKDGQKYVAPLIDPENVDKRRLEVGLEPLSEYVKYWNIIWDVKKHKERVARLEEEKR